jgi:DNA invertase Pin-like site-specific DNA recombinase
VRRTTALDDDIDTIGCRRVSKGEQAVEWKASLRQQTEAMLALAEKLGRVLRPEHIWEDRFSGEDAEDRKGFMAVVEFCRSHPRPRSRPGYVLFFNDSRFGRFREPDEAPHWRFEMHKCGWTVRFCENDDTDHPTTRHVMRAVGGAQASEYLANLRSTAKRGARGAAEQGLWQNEAPFGYRRLATAAGREPVVLEAGQRKSDDQQVRLTPGPKEEGELVQWMFQTYADGVLPLRRLAQALRRKAPGRLGWSHQAVAKMLANQTYLGHVIWCRRPHDKHERKEVKIRPESEWVVRENAHEPLVTQEVFDRVQARLAENKARTRSATSDYVLSGLVRCTYCGRPYIGGGGGSRKPGKDPDRNRIYKCAGSDHNNPVCPGRIGTVLKRVLEHIVIRMVTQVVSDPTVQRLIREEVERYLRELRSGSGEEKTSLTARQQKLAKEKGNLVDAIAEGVLTTEDAKAKMDRLRDESQDVEQKLARLGALPKVERQLAREADRLAQLAADFPARAKELSGPALRELLKPWIEEATFDKMSRVVSLTIRRVPAVASSRGGDLIAAAGRVQVQARLPRLERGSIGRYGAPNYSVVPIERKTI